MGIGDFIDKAKDLAQGHEDQVTGAVDKVEGVINEKTGGGHEGMIAKGADALENKLGIGGNDGGAA